MLFKIYKILITFYILNEIICKAKEELIFTKNKKKLVNFY